MLTVSICHCRPLCQCVLTILWDHVRNRFRAFCQFFLLAVFTETGCALLRMPLKQEPRIVKLRRSNPFEFDSTSVNFWYPSGFPNRDYAKFGSLLVHEQAQKQSPTKCLSYSFMPLDCSMFVHIVGSRLLCCSSWSFFKFFHFLTQQ